MTTDICPLCLASAVKHYHRDKRRDYVQCGACRLVFVPSGQRLTRDAEKAEYDLHENDATDMGYRRFLQRVLEPLLPMLPASARGLDFGCGPGPALQAMLQEAGFTVDVYDIFYAPDTSVFERAYDFITATEVVEHLHCPHHELNRLWQMLNPGGVLALMTKRVKDQAAFSSWHYKNDPTHVCFFSEQTFDWLAKQWRAEVRHPAPDVTIFQKPGQ